MNIRVPIRYVEAYQPANSQEWSLREVREQVRVAVREASYSEAPAAIRSWDKQARRVRWYWWYDGHLWTDRTLDGRKPFSLALLRGESETTFPRDMALRLPQALADQHLIREGKVLQEVGEPRYVLQLLGEGLKGLNSGGVSLDVAHEYSDRVSWHQYYRVDQRDRAVEEATQWAIALLETRSLPLVPQYEFEVLRPECLKLNPELDEGPLRPEDPLLATEIAA